MMSRKSHWRRVSRRAGAEIVDPVVHGVAAGEMDVGHLGADTALEIGLDVAEEEVRLGTVAFRELGVEIGEDVEIGLEGLAVVHIGGVFSGPEEGFTGNAVETGEIDIPGGEEFDVCLGEIFADHADDLHGREIGGGKGDVGAGSTEHAIDFSMGRFHAVISNGSNHD